MLPLSLSMLLLQFMPQLKDQSMFQPLNQFMLLLPFMLQSLPFTQLRLQQPQPPLQLLPLHQLQSTQLLLPTRLPSLLLHPTSQHLLMVPHNSSSQYFISVSDIYVIE
jgi:hypothetical protein